MAVSVIRSRKVMVNGVDISKRTKDLSLSIEVESLDGTNYDSSGTKIIYPGMISSNIEINGFFSAASTSGDNTDQMLYESLGANTEGTFLISPVNAATTGSLAYFGKGYAMKYNTFGNVGEIAPFNCSLQGTDVPDNGTIIFMRNVVNVSSAVGTVWDLGAIEVNAPVETILQLTNFSGSGTIKCYVYASCSSAYGVTDGAGESLVVSFTSKTDEGAEHKVGTVGTTEQNFFWVQYFSSGVNGSVTIAAAQNHGLE